MPCSGLFYCSDFFEVHDSGQKLPCCGLFLFMLFFLSEYGQMLLSVLQCAARVSSMLQCAARLSSVLQCAAPL